MVSKLFTTAAAALLLAVASAAPIIKRDACTPGLYNCIDGQHFAQCISGGTWSVTMSVAQGTSCNKGISANPFIPGDSSSSPSTGSSGSPLPPPPPPPPKNDPAPLPLPVQPTTTPVAQPTVVAPPPPPPTIVVAPITTTAPSGPAPTIPSGGNTGNNEFPDISKWQSYEAMKAKYVNIMGTSCEASGWGANNSPAETQQIFAAIESLHGSIDPRFLLAVTIQESSGCVRVITTNNGVRNPGLLQDSNGVHTCNDAGSILNPCPVDQINGMISDGVSGGSNNLQSALATAASNGFGNSFAYAVAARIYNSGSFVASDLNNGLGSTSHYVSDVMGRLVGTNL